MTESQELSRFPAIQSRRTVGPTALLHAASRLPGLTGNHDEEVALILLLRRRMVRLDISRLTIGNSNSSDAFAKLRSAD
jgi:hypothetical protein